MKDKISKKQAVYGRVFIVLVLALSLVIYLYVKFFSSLWSSRSTKFIRERSPAPMESTAVIQDRFTSLDNADPIILNEEEFSILHVNGDHMKKINTVYVIPGGGSSPEGGYPEWTKRRVVAAKHHYDENHKYSDTAIFLALSAGSLNSANSVLKDHRIRFECQHTIQHLLQLGVPRNIIFGDTFSWDTVTNGLTLRMFVEGLQEYRAQSGDNWVTAPEPPVSAVSPPPQTRTSQVPQAEAQTGTANEGVVASPVPAPSHVLKDLNMEVFISDFHADRVRASFTWILNLAPKVRSARLHINVVDSIGIKWQTSMDYTNRIAHEAQGTERIQKNAKSIRTMSQFYAFLTLGGHQGLHKYVHYDYETSKGGGWK